MGRATIIGLGASGPLEVGREVEIIDTSGDVAGQTYEYWYKLSTDKNWVSCNKKFTLPLEATCKKYPNSERASLSLCVRTYENGKNLGDEYGNDSLPFPKNIVPTASIANVKDSNTQTANAGQFLLGMSKLQADASGTGIYGSTIRSIVVTCNGSSVNVENGKINIPCNEQSLAIKLVVTDSRGRKATATKNVTVYKYAEPFIWEFKTYRCNNDGTPNEEGNFFASEFTPEATLYPSNSLSYKIENQKEGDTGWTLSVKKTGLNTWGKIKEVASIGADGTYTIKLTLYDKVSNVYYTRKLLSTYNVMDIKADGNGIAFGRASTENGFVCAMKSRFTEEANFDKEVYFQTPRGGMKLSGEILNLRDKKQDAIYLQDGYSKMTDGNGLIEDINGRMEPIHYTLVKYSAPTLNENHNIQNPTKKTPMFFFAWMQGATESYMLPYGTRAFINVIDRNYIYFKNPNRDDWTNYTLYVVLAFLN